MIINQAIIKQENLVQRDKDLEKIIEFTETNWTLLRKQTKISHFHCLAPNLQCLTSTSFPN